MQAFTKHNFGRSWDYHHDLGMLNRTQFFSNSLSDSVGGAAAFSDWTNGDLYERTSEHFNICQLPGERFPTSFSQPEKLSLLQHRLGLVLVWSTLRPRRPRARSSSLTRATTGFVNVKVSPFPFSLPVQ